MLVIKLQDGGIQARVAWKVLVHQARQQILQGESRSLAVIDDADGMRWERYLERFGDPAVNGKGHTMKIVNGETNVLFGTDGMVKYELKTKVQLRNGRHCMTLSTMTSSWKVLSKSSTSLWQECLRTLQL